MSISFRLRDGKIPEMEIGMGIIRGASDTVGSERATVGASRLSDLSFFPLFHRKQLNCPLQCSQEYKATFA